MPESTRTLGDLAELVRSKNAGPFWMTLDVFFATDADYEQAAASGVLTEDTIARLYQVDPATVALYRLPDIRVIKASFPRPVVQGSFADRDMHSGQQHIPLAGLSRWPPDGNRGKIADPDRGDRAMAHGEDRNERAGQPEARALFKGSDADIQEQERPWEAEEPEVEPGQPERIGIESPEADALEQARSWSSDDELEHPYG